MAIQGDDILLMMVSDGEDVRVVDAPTNSLQVVVYPTVTLRSLRGGDRPDVVRDFGGDSGGDGLLVGVVLVVEDVVWQMESATISRRSVTVWYL